MRLTHSETISAFLDQPVTARGAGAAAHGDRDKTVMLIVITYLTCLQQPGGKSSSFLFLLPYQLGLDAKAVVDQNRLKPGPGRARVYPLDSRQLRRDHCVIDRVKNARWRDDTPPWRGIRVISVEP